MQLEIAGYVRRAGFPCFTEAFFSDLIDFMKKAIACPFFPTPQGPVHDPT
jgi:hypothetical protein